MKSKINVASKRTPEQIGMTNTISIPSIDEFTKVYRKEYSL
jgi:hypothetical protein